MKLSAKPISSPGRTDKFPPPLVRFLRTNVGSRSRGRLRSSPMFVRKKNAAAAAVETQEPSSPKVTCMGQVRVRRSSKQGGSRTGGARRATGAPTRRRCKWISNALFCRHFSGIIKAKSFRPVWRKWVPFFQLGFCRKGEIKEDPPKIESKFEDPIEGCSDEEDFIEEQEDQEFERKAKAFVYSSSASTPPKNALLLTRCRSAPYRTSSLASRFWGSPVRAEETEAQQKPTSEGESISGQESRLESESEEKLEFFRELESEIRERMAKSASTEDKDRDFVGSGRPLILTRCKSEPARTAAEKLDPELCFWKTRRLGIVDSCSPSIL
ncbi:hypothetical protein ACFX12_032486 [Malus domestica]